MEIPTASPCLAAAQVASRHLPMQCQRTAGLTSSKSRNTLAHSAFPTLMPTKLCRYTTQLPRKALYFFVNLIVQLMHQTKPFATLTKLSWVMIWAFFELKSWNHLLHQFKVIFVPLLHHYLHFWIAHMIRSAIDRQSQAPGQMTNGHTILTVEANWIGVKWANHQKNNHFHFLLCWFLYPS